MLFEIHISKSMFQSFAYIFLVSAYFRGVWDGSMVSIFEGGLRFYQMIILISQYKQTTSGKMMTLEIFSRWIWYWMMVVIPWIFKRSQIFNKYIFISRISFMVSGKRTALSSAVLETIICQKLELKRNVENKIC